MRSPQEIWNKIETEPEKYNMLLLHQGLEQKVDHLASLVSNIYEEAFINALRHRPNGKLVDKFATLTWLAGSDLIVAEVPWLQFGMPRIRRMAKELNLPWIPTGDNELTLNRAKRMANGLPCTPKCVRCHYRG